MRKMRLYELEVRAGQLRDLDVRIIDADVVSAAIKALRKLHQRAFAQIVSLGLEAQTDDADPTLAGCSNHRVCAPQLLFIGVHRCVEDGRWNVQLPCSEPQSPQILRQARPTKSEAGLE